MNQEVVPHLLPLTRPPLYSVQESNPKRHFTQSLTHCTAVRQVLSSPTSLARIRRVTLGRKDCCHGLSFRVHSSAPLLPHGWRYSCWVQGSRSNEKDRQLEERSDMSCFQFGSKQWPLFHCSKERGRTWSYSRSVSFQLIPTNLQD